jgi:hypothetical protein
MKLATAISSPMWVIVIRAGRQPAAAICVCKTETTVPFVPMFQRSNGSNFQCSNGRTLNGFE